jgi:CheY-like chemotaxis protein
VSDWRSTTALLLIAEDDEGIAGLLCELFDGRGDDVTCASNGQRALDAVRMGGASGLDRARPPHADHGRRGVS